MSDSEQRGGRSVWVLSARPSSSSQGYGTGGAVKCFNPLYADDLQWCAYIDKGNSSETLVGVTPQKDHYYRTVS